VAVVRADTRAGRAWAVPSTTIVVLAAAAAAVVHTVGIARAVAVCVGKALHVLLWSGRPVDW
jgi:hypothetical protein